MVRIPRRIAMRVMLALVLVLAALAQSTPALAQSALTQYSEDPDTGEVTLNFELTIQGTPPAEASFFGFIPAEGGISTQLTDTDGDGLYTGSMTVPQYPPGPTPVPEGTEPVTLPVQIVTSSESKNGVPLYPELVEDFGQVLMDEDKTFSTAIVFDGPATPEGPDPSTPKPTTPEPSGPGPKAPEPGDADSPDVPNNIDVLPDTGGVTLGVLGAAALLLSGLLLFTGLRYTGFLRRR